MRGGEASIVAHEHGPDHPPGEWIDVGHELRNGFHQETRHGALFLREHDRSNPKSKADEPDNGLGKNLKRQSLVLWLWT